MYDDILLPTDGSDAAERALAAVVPLAARVDATIHVLHVYDLGEIPPAWRDEAGEQLASHGQELVSRLAAEAGDTDTTTAVVDTTGPIHESIIGYADDHDIDLIAMGARNLSGIRRFAIGSVTRRTLRLGDHPILAVGEDAEVGGVPSTVLLATDGSSAAAAAADHALELCAAFDAGLHVVNVVDVTGPWSTMESSDLLLAFEAAGKEAVDAVIERAEAGGIRSVQSSVLSGRPAEAIVEYAADRGVTLIVMGTHGRTGFERAIIGSVAEGVIGSAGVPVLAVKPARTG